jgi:phage-related protein
LGGGLWELRPEFGGTELRYFYFTIQNETIVMLHAVKKKSQKTNRNDLTLAKKRMEETRP